MCDYICQVWVCVSAGIVQRVEIQLDHFSFSENKAVGVMKPGHTFTIEPMISEGEI